MLQAVMTWNDNDWLWLLSTVLLDIYNHVLALLYLLTTCLSNSTA